MRLRARLVVGGGAQRAQHAAAHLGGGLARERDRDDLLGLLHGREQRQIALDQELGLAGARRRLNDERLRRVERGLARRCVAHRAHQRGTAPRASASCSNTRVNGAYAPVGVLVVVDEDARVAGRELVRELRELRAPQRELRRRVGSAPLWSAVPEKRRPARSPK